MSRKISTAAFSPMRSRYIIRERNISPARWTSGRRHASGAYETTARWGVRASAAKGRAECAECNGATVVPRWSRSALAARMPPESELPFFSRRRDATCRHSSLRSSRAEGEVRHDDQHAKPRIMRWYATGIRYKASRGTADVASNSATAPCIRDWQEKLGL